MFVPRFVLSSTLKKGYSVTTNNRIANQIRAHRLERTALCVVSVALVLFFYGVIIYAPLMIVGLLLGFATIPAFMKVDELKNRRM
jgi:hypothetical protein